MRLDQVVQSPCVTPCDVCPGTVAPAVRTCIGCELSYCRECLQRTHGNDGELGHCLVKPEAPEQPEVPRCRQHGQLVELFCETDGVPVCLECLQTGRHKGHSATSMEDWLQIEQERYDAKANRLRAGRYDYSYGIAGEESDEASVTNDIKGVRYPQNKERRGHVEAVSDSAGQATVNREGSGELRVRPLVRDDVDAGIGETTAGENIPRERRPVGWNYSSRGGTSAKHPPRDVGELVNPVVRGLENATAETVATEYLPQQHPNLHAGLSYPDRDGISRKNPTRDDGEQVKPVVRGLDNTTAEIVATEYLPQQHQRLPVGLSYPDRDGTLRTHPKRDTKEVVRPISRGLENATAETLLAEYRPRKPQQPARGCLSTGEILTYGQGREVAAHNVPVGSRRETENNFPVPRQRKINNTLKTGQKAPGVEYYNKDQESSAPDKSFTSTRIVDIPTTVERLQKQQTKEEKTVVPWYLNTGQTLVGVERGIHVDSKPNILKGDEDHSLSTGNDIYLSKSQTLPEGGFINWGIPTPSERQQHEYRPRNREQANKDVQQAVQEMFTKYVVTGHGLPTTELPPFNNSDTVATGVSPGSSNKDSFNRKTSRSPAIVRRARKLVGMPTATKATTIAQAVEIASHPALDSSSYEDDTKRLQPKSPSGLGFHPAAVGTPTSEPGARPTQRVRTSINLVLNQSDQDRASKFDTTKEDMQTSQSQNNGSFGNTTTETVGHEAMMAEQPLISQGSLKQAKHMPVTNPTNVTYSAEVLSGDENRLGDFRPERAPTNTTAPAPSSQRPVHKSSAVDEHTGKELGKTSMVGQGMKLESTRAQSSPRISARRGKSSSKDIPTHPASVNMALSRGTASTKPKRQEYRNGSTTSVDKSGRRQQATHSTAAQKGHDASAALRIARVLPQRRERSGQDDTTAQSSLPKILPALCGVGHTWITLRWTVPDAENFKAYQVQYQKQGGPVKMTPFRYGSTRETVDNLSPGTTYAMQVRALDVDGRVHCSNKVEMKTSSRRLTVPAQTAETANRLSQAVQQVRSNNGQDPKSKQKFSRWTIGNLTSSFRRKKKAGKSAASGSETDSKASYSESPLAGRRESDQKRSSMESLNSEVSTVSTTSKASQKSRKRVHFKEEDISKAYDIREMEALYPELSNVEQVIGDNVSDRKCDVSNGSKVPGSHIHQCEVSPEITNQVGPEDDLPEEEAKLSKEEAERNQTSDVKRRNDVSSPIFMTLMDQSEESEAESFQRVADTVRGAIRKSTKVSVEVQTNEGGVYRPAAIRSSTVRGSGEDNMANSPEKSASLPEWETNVDATVADKSAGFRNTNRERTWKEIIEDDYDPKEGWKNVQVGNKMRFIDLEAIKPYRKVLTHAGYYGDKSNAIVVFSSCYMPNSGLKDYEYIMENLFLYILSFLDKVVEEEYKIVFLNYTKDRSNLPSVTWLKSCYDHIDAKFKKKLKGLFIVHPTIWLKMLVHVSKPFVSSKFSKKLQFVDNFKDLMKQLPVDPEAIPEDVKKFEEELVGGGETKGGTFAALKAALGKEVQKGSVPENAFCAPYNKGLASTLWEGFPTLRL